MALEITDGNITEILGSNKITVLDFWAPWCGPCRMLGPIIEELASSNADIAIGKLNVDENQESAVRYGVRGIPTMIFFKDGEIVDKIVGVKSKAELQAKIDSLKS
jgi:thioredoxin 1